MLQIEKFPTDAAGELLSKFRNLPEPGNKSSALPENSEPLAEGGASRRRRPSASIRATPLLVGSAFTRLVFIPLVTAETFIAQIWSPLPGSFVSLSLG